MGRGTVGGETHMCTGAAQAAQASDGETASVGDGVRSEAETPSPASKAPRLTKADGPEEGDMASMMMSRKTRKVYESVLKSKREKRQRAATLMERSKRVRTTWDRVLCNVLSGQ